MTTQLSNRDVWPGLRVDDWASTRDTLHMWMQIVGKIRLAHAPLLNHWWQPDGFADHTVAPPDATCDRDLGEFLLPYEVLRTAPEPDRLLGEFLQSTYQAAAIHRRLG